MDLTSLNISSNSALKFSAILCELHITQDPSLRVQKNDFENALKQNANDSSIAEIIKKTWARASAYVHSNFQFTLPPPYQSQLLSQILCEVASTLRVLESADPNPIALSNVLIAGVKGVGKTTLMLVCSSCW